MCTPLEKERLRRYINDFDVLYRDCMASFRSYQTVKDRFDKIKPIIIDALQDVPIIGIRSLYGFPKGRRKHDETEIGCALREFEEEIGIDKKFIKLLGFPPLEEIYTGSDGKEYKNVYFRCEIPFMAIPRKIKTSPKIPGRELAISNEIHDILWLTKNQAKMYLDGSTFEL